MPKVSGKDLISESTEKSLNKLLLFASAAILAKLYDIPFGNMKLLSVEIPAAVFDVTLLVLTLYFFYIYIIQMGRRSNGISTVVSRDINIVQLRYQHEVGQVVHRWWSRSSQTPDRT